MITQARASREPARCSREGKRTAVRAKRISRRGRRMGLDGGAAGGAFAFASTRMMTGAEAATMHSRFPRQLEVLDLLPSPVSIRVLCVSVRSSTPTLVPLLSRWSSSHLLGRCFQDRRSRYRMAMAATARLLPCRLLPHSPQRAEAAHASSA